MIRLYALLLYLYPPSFRRAHGREMLQFVRVGGRPLRLTADLLCSLPREWVDALRPPRGRHRELPGTRSRPGDPMRHALSDLRHAARLLRRNPGFTAAALLTLALGIGANTAIFSLADATLLRPLDVTDPEDLVTFSWSSSYPHYQEYVQRQDVFHGVIAVGGGPRVSLSFEGRNELATAAFVSGNTFDVLGVSAALGRTLLPSDDVPNGPIVAVLGYDYWQSRFAGRSDVVGRSITANGRPAIVVGVARKGFRGTTLFSNPAIYFPVTATPQVRTGLVTRVPVLTTPGFVWLTVIGRLRDGVTVAQAESAMDTLYRELVPPRPGREPERLMLEPLETYALGSGADSVRRFVLLLAGAVGLTLLIGCANLANLLLARATARRREIGVRLALGAGRSRVVRQMLAESLLLASIGGVLGLLVAATALRLLGAYQLPGGLDIEGLGLGVNRQALVVTAALSLATGLLFGAAPAWRASRTDVMVSLRDDTRGASARNGLRSGLVAAQVALSLVLLTGSGLFLRSLVHALDVPLGFEVRGVALASVNLGLVRYDDARSRQFYLDALARVRALPQVRSAAWTNVVPTRGGMMFDLEIEGYRPAADEDMTFDVAHTGPEYFSAAGTRILAGRAFGEQDDERAPKVAIVNVAAAQKYFDGQALGRRVKQGRQAEWITIVGVAENTKIRRLDEEPGPLVYLPFNQGIGGIFGVDNAHLMARTSGDATALLPLLAGQLRAVDPEAPVFDVRTFEEAVSRLVMPQRMGVALLGFFSTLALVLATIGIYGVASYVAALRAREIGIRMALGAGRREIGSLILRQGSRPVLAGLVAGLALAWWATRLAATFLYDVSPHDPATFVTVASVMTAVALSATWLPARRAARTDPVVALRQE